jgi:hypothetical protein
MTRIVCDLVLFRTTVAQKKEEMNEQQKVSPETVGQN